MLLSLQTKLNPVLHQQEFKKPANNEMNLGLEQVPEGESIVYFSDFHSNISKLPKVAGLITYIQSRLERENILKACAGDFLFGNTGKNIDIIIEFFNKIKLNALTLGNHEFDTPLNILKSALTKIKSHILVANLNPDAEKLPVKDTVTIELKLQPFGLIGITIDSKSSKINPLQVSFEETLKKVQQKLDEFTKNGIKKVVLISHLGFDKDKKILENTSGIDIIISAHNHFNIDGVKSGINLFQTKSNEPAVIFQAAKDNDYLGYARVAFNKDGLLTKIFNKTIPTNTPFSKEDRSIAKLIKEKFSNKTLAFCQKDLMINQVNYSENPLANFVADSINKQLPNADVILLPSRMIRTGLKKGKVKEINIDEILPDRNDKAIESYVILKLSTSKLIDLIQNINRLNKSGYGEVLTHVSGIKYKIDKDFKVTDLQKISKNGEYIDLYPNDTLNVGIPGYIINTKKFNHLTLGQEVLIEKTDKTASELVKAALNSIINIINPSLDGRIILEKEIRQINDYLKLPEFIQIPDKNPVKVSG